MSTSFSTIVRKVTVSSSSLWIPASITLSQLDRSNDPIQYHPSSCVCESLSSNNSNHTKDSHNDNNDTAEKDTKKNKVVVLKNRVREFIQDHTSFSSFVRRLQLIYIFTDTHVFLFFFLKKKTNFVYLIFF